MGLVDGVVGLPGAEPGPADDFAAGKARAVTLADLCYYAHIRNKQFIGVGRTVPPNSPPWHACFADVSVRLWQTAGSFDASKGTLRGWLTVLARNCALNRARGLRTETALTDDMPHGAGSAEDALLRQERSRLLVRAVKSLTDGEQTLFYRKYYYCQSTAQMAAELGLTERGVEGRLYRLRQSLRQQLGGDFCDG